MKQVNNILKYAIISLLFAGALSCGKDGTVGPLGPAGQQGEKGEQGAKGADGTMLRYGNGAPTASLGNENDFYIDVQNSNLYGPKTNNSWGTATGLKGATGSTGSTGAKGADGSQFLSGASVPTTQGKIGDFYFRTTTATLYGPKTESGWGTGTSLKGEKGDKGDKGDRGNDGNADVKSYSFEIAANSWEESAIYGFNARWNVFFVNNNLIGDRELRHMDTYATIAYISSYFDGKSYSRSVGMTPLTETFDTYKITYELDLKNAWIIMSKNTNAVNKMVVPLAERPDKVKVQIVMMKLETVNMLKGKVDLNDYQAVAKHFNLNR